MWSLKFLTGPQMGQVIQLKNGKNLIGRGDQCDIRISTQGISKEHAEIQVYSDKMMIVDLRSSNGTFVNGIKIQNSLIKLGDKVITGPYTEVSKNLKSGDKVRIKEDKDDKKEEK